MNKITHFVRKYRVAFALLILIAAFLIYILSSPLRFFTISRYTKKVTGISIEALDEYIFDEENNNKHEGQKLRPAEIERLINEVRLHNNLPLLNHDTDLTHSSTAKLNDMINNDYFSHVSPQNKTPWQFITEAGYSYDHVGENLASGTFDNESEVVKAWLNSASHKSIILDKRYCDIGVSTDQKEFYDNRFDIDIIVMHVGVRSYSTFFGICEDL